MEITLVIILIFVLPLIGFFIGKTIFKTSANAEKKILEERNNSLRNEYEKLEHFSTQQKKDFQEQINKINTEKTELINEKESLIAKLSEKETQNKNLQQKYEEQEDQLRVKFENLANKILEEKSSKFTLQNKENIGNLLNPLQEKIQLFEKKIEESQKENIGLHSSLKEQLSNLHTQNLKITQEAENLTKALKGESKTQGIWGELVLEKVLEKSGLEKGREYFVQQSFESPNDQNKRAMPDVVVHLPDKKKIIIDSKVSLTYYERFVNEEDQALKEQYIKEHLNSIKRHVEQLSEKKYQDIYKMESPDFILLFVPIEPAFAVALNHDNSIYNKAFDKNIVIVTPTTLLATLKTVNSLWINQKRQKNAEQIAKLAGTLYDKFVGYVEDLEKIGKKLDAVKTDYNNAKTKLTGNGGAMVSLEKLKKMGATPKTTKDKIPQILLDEIQESEEINEIEISDNSYLIS